MQTGLRYSWAKAGDWNAFFGLMLDNVGDMILMASLLVGVYGFPTDFVLTQMIPGTAFGVLIGDLAYTSLAFRLARRTGRQDVTAMPLGLDTPSTFGAVFLILGPAYQTALARQTAAGEPADPTSAAQHAWFLGITMLIASGVFKTACAFISGWIRRSFPRAGLLGSLVAIALVIISFLPLLEIAASPIPGFVAMVVMLATLSARRRMHGALPAVLVGFGVAFAAFALVRQEPGGLAAAPSLALAGGVGLLASWGISRVKEVPGALLAVCLGMGLYYGLFLLGWGPGPSPRPARGLAVSLPWAVPGWLAWIREWWAEAASYLPVAIPLALATVVGGIDCAESAAAAGDDYDTGQIVAIEGLATLVSGCFGGVIQSTPYIGHPAYKAMGGRAAYTLATALFVGAVGIFGLFGWIFHVLPRPAIYPILVFVGIEITQHSFRATPRKHYPALVLACVPALAYLAYLMVDRLAGEVDRVFGADGATFARFAPEIQNWIQILAVLASGFIVTSLIWGTWLARLIDGQWKAAAGVLVLGGLLAVCGIIHSPLRGSPILPPGQVDSALHAQKRFEATRWIRPLNWSVAYLGMAAALVIIGLGSHGSEEDKTTLAEDQNNMPIEPDRTV